MRLSGPDYRGSRVSLSTLRPAEGRSATRKTRFQLLASFTGQGPFTPAGSLREVSTRPRIRSCFLLSQASLAHKLGGPGRRAPLPRTAGPPKGPIRGAAADGKGRPAANAERSSA